MPLNGPGRKFSIIFLLKRICGINNRPFIPTGQPQLVFNNYASVLLTPMQVQDSVKLDCNSKTTPLLLELQLSLLPTVLDTLYTLQWRIPRHP